MSELIEIVEPDIADLLYEELPEGWSYAKLGQIGKWKGGGTPSKANANYWSGGTIPWVSPKDMKSSRIDDAEDKITEDAVRKSTTNLIEAGSILIVTRSGILRSHVPVAMNSVPVTINQDLKALTVNPNYSAEYVLQYLLGFNRVLLLQAGKVGTTVESIDFEALKEFAIRVPPFSEQQKIAAILGKWDEGIRKLQKLIAYKTELKSGLMEQLLTEKKRFKEFAGTAWETIRFGEVFDFIRNESHSRECLTYEETEGKVYYIHYGDIHAAFKDPVLSFRRGVRVPYLKDDIPASNRMSLLQEGDLVIADASEDYEGVGACVEIGNLGDRLAVGGLHTIVARDNKGRTVNGIRSYLLKHPAVVAELKKVANGISVYGLSKNALANILIHLPPLPEQRRIATVLSAADLELKGLREELALLRQQKAGLMHRLLTRGTGTV